MMFSSLINKAGDNPEYGYGYQERQPFQWKWWHAVLILIAIFPYVCIFALFGMVSNIKHETTNNNYYSLIGASSQLTSSGSVSVGNVVSLTSSGKIQAGAGTSIYKSIVDFEATCPSYLSMDAVYTNAYLTSYANKGSLNATLQVMTMSSPNKANVASSMETHYFMYEVLSLSTSNGLFIGVTQDSSNNSETAFVVAGKVDGATYKVSLGHGVQYASNYSMDPQITRLSDTTFALAYYTYAPGFLATRFGSVDPTSLVVTLSEEYLYQNNTHYSYYSEVVGMSESQFMLMYFDSYDPSDPTNQGGSGPLSVVVATINGDPSSPHTATLSFSNATTLTNSALTYYFTGTLLEANTTVIAYVDANNNQGITCQVIKLVNDISGTPIVFGASWMVTSGQALTDLTNWIMDLDIAVVSDAGSFMVLYSDISNNGAMTATVGQLTVSGDLLRGSPDFVLNTGNSQLDSVYSWGALASGVSNTLDSQTAILTSLTDFNCEQSAVSTFSMMGVLPLPFGIVTSVTNGVADIAVSGTVSSSSLRGLTTGVNYYTNTMGSVLASTTYYGRESTSDGSTYFYVDDGSTIVTLDSKVGLATASNAVYIQPK